MQLQQLEIVMFLLFDEKDGLGKEKINSPLDCLQNTALHLAIEHFNFDNCFKIVQQLLTVDEINLDVQNAYQETPLMFAAGSGLVNIVKLLQEKKANVMLQDSQGNSALHWAIQSKYKIIGLEVYQSIDEVEDFSFPEFVPEKVGRDEISTEENTQAIIGQLLSMNKKEIINLPNHLGRTPLMEVFVSKKTQYYSSLFPKLVHYGANLEDVDKKNHSAFHHFIHAYQNMLAYQDIILHQGYNFVPVYHLFELFLHHPALDRKIRMNYFTLFILECKLEGQSFPTSNWTHKIGLRNHINSIITLFMENSISFRPLTLFKLAKSIDTNLADAVKESFRTQIQDVRMRFEKLFPSEMKIKPFLQISSVGVRFFVAAVYNIRRENENNPNPLNSLRLPEELLHHIIDHYLWTSDGSDEPMYFINPRLATLNAKDHYRFPTFHALRLFLRIPEKKRDSVLLLNQERIKAFNTGHTEDSSKINDDLNKKLKQYAKPTFFKWPQEMSSKTDQTVLPTQSFSHNLLSILK